MCVCRLLYTAGPNDAVYGGSSERSLVVVLWVGCGRRARTNAKLLRYHKSYVHSGAVFVFAVTCVKKKCFLFFSLCNLIVKSTYRWCRTSQ